MRRGALAAFLVLCVAPNVVTAEREKPAIDAAIGAMASRPTTAREARDFETLKEVWRLIEAGEPDPGEDPLVSASKLIAAEPGLRKAKRLARRVNRRSKYKPARDFFLQYASQRIQLARKLKRIVRRTAGKIRSQRKRRSKGARAPPRIAPHCAENGSCWGDISVNTGRPKTVHVRGYYRKDGTYVRGHYRSPAR